VYERWRLPRASYISHRALAGEYSSACIFIHHHYIRRLAHEAWRPAEAILAALRGDLCTILHVNFAESYFPRTPVNRL
jgi:hypothetical protein